MKPSKYLCKEEGDIYKMHASTMTHNVCDTIFFPTTLLSDILKDLFHFLFLIFSMDLFY